MNVSACSGLGLHRFSDQQAQYKHTHSGLVVQTDIVDVNLFSFSTDDKETLVLHPNVDRDEVYFSL